MTKTVSTIGSVNNMKVWHEPVEGFPEWEWCWSVSNGEVKFFGREETYEDATSQSERQMVGLNQWWMERNE